MHGRNLMKIIECYVNEEEWIYFIMKFFVYQIGSYFILRFSLGEYKNLSILRIIK
jgi:hypothetical protein